MDMSEPSAYTKPEHAPVQVVDFPTVMTVSPVTGGPMIIQVTSMHPVSGKVMSAVEYTMIFPHRWIAEFSWNVEPPCGHYECSLQVSTVLN